MANRTEDEPRKKILTGGNYRKHTLGKRGITPRLRRMEKKSIHHSKKGATPPLCHLTASECNGKVGDPQIGDKWGGGEKSQHEKKAYIPPEKKGRQSNGNASQRVWMEISTGKSGHKKSRVKKSKFALSASRDLWSSRKKNWNVRKDGLSYATQSNAVLREWGGANLKRIKDQEEVKKKTVSRTVNRERQRWKFPRDKKR